MPVKNNKIIGGGKSAGSVVSEVRLSEALEAVETPQVAKPDAAGPFEELKRVSVIMDDRLEKQRQRNANRKAARQLIQSALADVTFKTKLYELDKDFVTALITCFGQPRVAGAAAGNKLVERLLAAFAECEVGQGLDELEIFKTFKIGRGEMRRKSRDLLKQAPPEERLWLDFDISAEKWVVLGRGPKAPEGWGGFVPPVA